MLFRDPTARDPDHLSRRGNTESVPSGSHRSQDDARSRRRRQVAGRGLLIVPSSRCPPRSVDRTGMLGGAPWLREGAAPRRTLLALTAAGGLIAAAAAGRPPAPVDCVLRTIGVETVGDGARLRFGTDGSPTALGTRLEPGGGIVLDLAGCVPGPQLAGRTFPAGLVSALQLVHRSDDDGPITGLVVETRQPCEYSVSSGPGRVEILLLPVLRPAAEIRRPLIRVMEPLPPRAPPSASPAPETDPGPGAATAGAAAIGRLLEGARLSVARAPRYDSAYRVISYPGGDPGWDTGSGVDIIIRAFRHAKVDLQQLIHEDILANRSAYGIRTPDPNIDHRRLRNLATFLFRHGHRLATEGGDEWQPGDLVFWSRDDDSTNHVGIVSDRRGEAGRPLVIHHLPGRQPREEDVLKTWPIRAGYRWLPAAETTGE